MSFSNQISAWTQKVEKAAGKIFRGSALEIFKTVIKRTPVDTGRLKGNWQVGINTKPSGETGVDDKSGGKTANTGGAIIGKAKIGNVIYLVNNMDYVLHVENGTDKQRPVGMVKLTIQEWDATVKAKAKK